MSVRSELSKSSQMTQQIFDDVSGQNKLKLIRTQGVIDQESLESAWQGFGAYISKQLRIGRAVSVPKLGLFTFSAPEVNLNGTTNPKERELEKREPVFKIYSNIAKGLNLKPAILKKQGLRPLTISSTAGKIQEILISYSDISNQLGVDKDVVKLSVLRIIKRFDAKIREGEETAMLEIPTVGTIIIRNGLAALAYNEFLKKDTVGLFKKSIQERRKDAESNLTSKNLKELIKISNQKKLDDILEIDENAQNWLEENLDIKFEGGISGQGTSSKYKTNIINNQSNSKGFTSTFQGKNFKSDTLINNPLLQNNGSVLGYTKMSLIKRAGTKNATFSLENQILTKIRGILHINDMNPEESFLNLVTGLFGINANLQSKMKKDQLLQAFQKQNIDLYDYEVEALFKKIDFKKDQVIDLDEWVKIVCQEKTPQEFLLEQINIFGGNNQNIMKKIEITKDSHPLSKQQVINCFKKLNPALKNKDLARISNYIMKGKLKIPVEQFCEFFSSEGLVQNNGIQDEDEKEKEWYNDMLKLIKMRLLKRGNPKSMMEKFQSMDQTMEGMLDIANFKTCLLQLDLNIDPDHFHKFIKNVDVDIRQRVDYVLFFDSIFQADVPKEERGGLQYIANKIQKVLIQKRFDYKDFLLFLTENKSLKKQYQIENPNQIKAEVFGQLLASQIFPLSKQASVLAAVPIIDVDNDGIIDQYDLKTFLGRYAFFEELYLKRPVLTQSEKFSNSMSVDNLIKNSRNFSQTSKNQNGVTDNNKSDNYENQLLINGNGVTQSQDFVINNESQNYGKTSNSLNRINSQNSFNNSQASGNKTTFQFFNPKAILKDPGVKNFTKSRLFPTQNLPKEKLATLINEMKRIITLNKQTYEEVFQRIDENQDGLLTIQEFYNGMDKVMKLSHEAKLGLFAYFDQQNIGMFDQSRFVGVLSRIDNNLYPTNFQDDWSWQMNIIKKWRSWFRNQKISMDEAFKLADSDFDGFLNQKDIEKFLTKFLQISEKDLDEMKVQRLYQLFDTRKRGCVQIKDLEKILLEDGEFFDDQKQTPNQQKDEKLNFHHKYWLENAKKHISVYIMKNFDSVQESFEKISNMGDQILFRQFKKWLEEKVVLQGFNLSDQLLQTFFSYIDPHKKGYLSSSDWEKSFGQLTGKTNLALQDLKFMAYTNFNCFKDFVEFLKDQGHGEKINFLNFSAGVKNLSQKIYDLESIYQVWLQICSRVEKPQKKSTVLEEDDLSQVFLSFRFKKQQEQIEQSIVQRKLFAQSTKSFSDFKKSQFSGQKSFNQNQFKHLTTTSNIYDRFKNLLIGSGKSIQFAFEEADTTKSGKISTIQFKNILMKLNLGLTQKEIETLILLNSINGDYISYKNFLHKLKSSQSSEQMVDRSEQRIIKLRQQLYDYLISPKDAFRRYDDDKSNTMSFSEFREFLIQLSSFTKEESPPYTVAKDMFDFIDITSDNKIDMEEWVETFARYDKVQPRVPRMPKYEVVSSEYFAKKKVAGLGNRYDRGPKSLSSSRSEQRLKLLENRFDKPIYKNYADDEYKTMSYGDHFKSIQGISLKWERTAQYDSVIKLIGKNRRILVDDFINAGAEGDKLLLHKSKVIAILDRCLKHYNINIQPTNWEVIVRFAEEKDQNINCKFMLEVYKKRLIDHDSQPHNFKKNVFFQTGSAVFNHSNRNDTQ